MKSIPSPPAANRTFFSKPTGSLREIPAQNGGGQVGRPAGRALLAATDRKRLQGDRPRPARALGLWQFIPSTGYRYNLNRDKYIDERLDPDKATRGAIEYLRELHEMFGDWATVLAGYNCGENRLRTIQSQNINYLDNFWDLYERLPRETARYVPRFLATLHIISSPEKYGLNAVPVSRPCGSKPSTSRSRPS